MLFIPLWPSLNLVHQLQKRSEFPVCHAYANTALQFGTTVTKPGNGPSTMAVTSVQSGFLATNEGNGGSKVVMPSF